MDAKHCNKLELYVLNILEVQGFEQPVSLDLTHSMFGGSISVLDAITSI